LRQPYVYLGYWIEASRKMAYKSHFAPLEAWDGRRWSNHLTSQNVATVGGTDGEN
jgi:arginine-tRNA-protein transferase